MNSDFLFSKMESDFNVIYFQNNIYFNRINFQAFNIIRNAKRKTTHFKV